MRDDFHGLNAPRDIRFNPLALAIVMIALGLLPAFGPVLLQWSVALASDLPAGWVPALAAYAGVGALFVIALRKGRRRRVRWE